MPPCCTLITLKIPSTVSASTIYASTIRYNLGEDPYTWKLQTLQTSTSTPLTTKLLPMAFRRETSLQEDTEDVSRLCFVPSVTNTKKLSSTPGTVPLTATISTSLFPYPL